MLSALMYVVVPMPCMFFGGGSTQFLTSRDGGGLVTRDFYCYFVVHETSITMFTRP